MSEYKKVSPCGDMALLPSTAIRLASDLFSTIPITTQETLLIDSFGSATSYPDSYMLRLLFDLLLSPTQFSPLPAVRMLAYNLYLCSHSSTMMRRAHDTSKWLQLR